MNTRAQRGIQPIRVLPLGFASIILVGTLLLALPFAREDGVPLSFFDALFTATSATCVTGLTVVTTDAFSWFGQLVILLMMQVGGLGFMILTANLFLLVRHKVSLFERLTLKENLGESSLTGLRTVSLRAARYAAICEGAGFLLLLIRFLPQFGLRGAWVSLFTSVSAFCNAGFDLMGDNSLLAYVGDPLVCLVVMALIVAGGIGFAVAGDIEGACTHKKRHLQLNTRLVLCMTVGLIVVGAAAIALLEWRNPATLGGLPWYQKILASAFQSVTLRTAGFATVRQEQLTEASRAISILWMLVGGSPTGTAGGLKTTTYVVLFLAVWSSMHGRKKVCIGKHTIAHELVYRALSLFLMALTLLSVTLIAVCIVEANSGVSLLNLLFELTSAFCTVGLSSGVTATASMFTRSVLILLMFVGRVGLITFAMSLAGRDKVTAIQYPEENLPIG